jgi:hypothetical protein
MKLIKGLVTDVNDIDVPEGSWKYARNGMYIQQGAVSNELGFNKLSSTPSDLLLIGEIPLPDDRVIMFYTENSYENNRSYIYILNANGSTIKLIDSDLLNFNRDYPINGKFKFNNLGEIIIVFTDNHNPPRLINLKSGNELINITNDKEFNLFHNLEVARIANIRVQAGGTLLSGTYQFAFKYKYEDRSESNVFLITNPIPVFSGSSRLYNSLEGDVAGIQTSKAIKVDMQDLDTNFSSLVIYVIKTINQITTAEVISEISISQPSNSFLYSGAGASPVALSEILTSFSSYDKIKKFEIHQDFLFGANVSTSDIDLNFQAVANQIVVKWNAEESVNLDIIRGSYKDPNTVYFKRAFMPNEVYALYIRGIYKNGGRTEAYHIPGREAFQGEKDVLPSGHKGRDIDREARIFHFENTATRDTGRARGLMGYWENETEKYPNSDLWGGLKNTPVRHHRFPTREFVKESLGNLVRVGAGNQLRRTSSHTAFNQVFEGFDFDHDSFLQTYDRNFVKAAYIVDETGFYNFTYTINAVTRKKGTDQRLDDGVYTPTSGGDTYLNAYIYIGTEANREQRLVTIISQSYSSNSDSIFINEFINVNDVELTEGEYVTVVVQVTAVGYHFGDWIIDMNHTIISNLRDVPVELNVKESVILGVELSNLQFPSEILDRLQGFEILYAQKGTENSQVVGHGLMIKQDWFNTAAFGSEGRFYGFDALTFKPALNLSHLWINVFYGNVPDMDITTVEEEYGAVAITYNQRLNVISDHEYIPENNTAVDPTNVFREEHLRLVLGSAIPVAFAQKNFIVELHSFKKDVYLSFDKQTLVSTGKIFPLVPSTGPVLGGDTFLSPYGINIHWKRREEGASADSFHYRTYNIWTYSIGNVGLRTSGKDRTYRENYFPVGAKVRDLWNRVPDTEIDPAIVSLGGATLRFQKELLVSTTTDLYRYNIDYSRLNSQLQTGIFLDRVPVRKYPYRVIRGLPSIRESDVETWRNFPAFDYYEMPKEKGEITTLASLGSILLIHQKYMLYRTRGNGVLRLQSNQEIQLGDGDVFEFRPEEVIPVGLSYAGTQSMYAARVTKQGYVFIDGSQGKLFIYGSELKEISNVGMLNYFARNFQYTGIDNPYIGQGFSLGYDPRYNRLLFSKSGNGENITISYSNYIDAWGFFHSYKAGVLFETPNKLFSIQMYNPSNTRNVYEHNIDGKHGLYYDQENPEPFIIDVPIVQDYRISKKTLSVSWIMDRIKDGSLRRDKTFDKIFLHNSFQASDYTTLDYYNFLSGNLRNVKSTWSFDMIRNIGLGNTPIDENGEIVMENLDVSKPWYEKEEFEDKYIVVRFVCENSIEDNKQDIIFLYDVSANQVLKIR